MGCYVGVDVAKHFHVAAVVDEEGQVLRTLHFDNNLTGYQRFEQILSPKMLVALEATGHYGNALRELVAQLRL